MSQSENVASEQSNDAVEKPAAELGDTSRGQIAADTTAEKKLEKEYGGPLGLEPTRYGDWERKGRCIDF